MEQHIKINIHPLNSLIEEEVLKKLNFKPPESYAPIDKNILELIFKEIKEKYPSDTNNFYKEIILSIRSNYMKNKMITNHKKIQKNIQNIINDYNNNSYIL